MKPFLILGLMIQLSAAQAMADSFTVIREGREYLCSTTGNGPRPPSGPGGGAADCANKAYNGPFSRSESMELCSGAYDEGPADCGIKAYAGPFSRKQQEQSSSCQILPSGQQVVLRAGLHLSYSCRNRSSHQSFF